MSATSEVTGDRLVFLHGFTQTHHHWHAGAERVVSRLDDATGRRPDVVLPDLPGHGLSAGDSSGIDDAAAQLASTVGRGTYIGYSMGGRVALHVALSDARPVGRLVLIGATAGLRDARDRTDRRRVDEERACRIEEIGVEAFLDEWLAAPLFATLPPDPAGLDHRRRNTAAGLAHSLRTAGTGTQRSLWDELPSLDIPVLLIAGELDTKFTAIAHEMAAILPHAQVAIIDGAGHAAHSERPDQVAGTIAAWLEMPPTDDAYVVNTQAADPACIIAALVEADQPETTG
jgi:2-succinyl-6-hydroxy-2,4-cyclohexadiene-1-carboxylate synthase